MIKLKVFSNFCSSDQAINNYKNVYNLNINNPYSDKIDFTYGDDFTHALLLNETMVDIDLPKENILGLAFEPPQFLHLTNEYMRWVQEKMSHYYLGINLNDTFINHYTFMWHHWFRDINHTPNKVNLMSIVFSNKKSAPGHKYRWDLVKRILESNLPIDIWGYGCDELGISDSRIKGPFEYNEPYKDYKYSICIENHQLDDYITEKFNDCLIDKTIPIYLGARRANHYFNDSFITLTGDIDKDMSLLTDICKKPDLYVKDVELGLNELISGKANLFTHLLDKFNA
jgi:hypothetical protein